MAELTALEILNTIRANQSDAFKALVPKATSDNLQQVGKALMGIDESLLNGFVNDMMNKIGLMEIRSRMYENALSKLKGSKMPYGSIAEESFINPVEGNTYSNEGTLLLKDYTPDSFTAYYKMNRQSEFPISIREEELARAFTDEIHFMRFLNSLLSAPYSGDNYEEEELTKGMMGAGVNTDAILCLDADIEKPIELAKAISNVAKDFTKMRSDYCPYNRVNATEIAKTGKKAKTFCPKNEQILFVRQDVVTELDYELLANFYHIPVDMLERNTIEIDNFYSTKRDVLCILADSAALQIHDNVFKMKKQEIGSALRWNYFLHHWQTIYLSMFANIVAFCTPIKPVTPPTSGGTTAGDNG